MFTIILNKQNSFLYCNKKKTKRIIFKKQFADVNKITANKL